MLRRDDQQLIKKAEEIARLLFLEMNEELSPSERQTLNEWLDQQNTTTLEFFGDITDRRQLDKDMQAYSAIDVNKALKDVQKKIAATRPGQDQELTGLPPSRRKFGLAAIALLGILFTGAFVWVYLHLQRKTTIEDLPIARHFRNDVPPGSDKAVLTLADGTKINLDHAANGDLTLQGATQVRKLGAGQLTYYAAGARKQAPGQIAYNTVSTPRGGEYQVLLSDGSKVWLNAASSLRFPTAFTGTARRVELTGEAYFEIAPNASLPFKVSIIPPERSDNSRSDNARNDNSRSENTKTKGTGTNTPLEIEVLGTAFDVAAYADESDQKTTLVSGAVKVINGREQSVLKPGQQARIENAPGAALQVASDINTEEVISWKDGSFLFQSATIEYIMHQLARWYDVDVKYEGEKPLQRLTANVSRKNNLSDILRTLEISGYHFDIRGRTIIVKQ